MSDAAAAFRATKSFCTVNGYQMAYVEMKDNSEDDNGDTLLFLHGNPTSSYVWRNVMAPLRGSGRRLIAPDLIGMGDSDKLANSSDDAYRFVNHADFLDRFITHCVKMGKTEKLVLVIHDWGSVLGFHWAFHHQDQVKGIVWMEGIPRPWTYNDFDAEFAEFFLNARTSGVGEQMMLEDNFFIEVVLDTLILRNLTSEEMDVYRAPYLNPGEDRRPTLAWPREVPINGTPADVVEIVEAYGEWMAESNLPKLLIVADPGVILVGDVLELGRSWPNTMEVTMPGLHFLQEDSPNEVATAISDWLDSDVFFVDLPVDAPHSGSLARSPSGAIYLLLVLAASLVDKYF